ncbi:MULTISPECIES: cytochrome c oxidase subunit II [Arthrobacter]|uniref:cytochrome-c oxidase n=1 Tax=Arthrobacter silviterrae TaxID=2026658 RepID=A0ABX0DHA1_9MICC|nr:MULTISPECIES: cytochrome c oxidase subunit II [Arthrobacter]MCU6481555.1 cytochrome c oxidase subunit II [Arthrobacter sp. A2-55]NGN85170.1 cytochrome c oxidase subunit II [Arthrobacter silviterrae]
MSSQDRTGSRRAKVIPIAGLAIAGALALSGCTAENKNGWMPGQRDTTNHTAGIIDLWVNTWITVLIIGLITWGLIIWCIIAYRRRKDAVGFPRQTSYNLPLEVFYVLVPLFMVFVFFHFTDVEQKSITARVDNPDVTIDVRAKQWAWDFNYMQGNDIKESVYSTGVQAELDGKPFDKSKLPTLYLPVNRTVELQLNSRDVVHSFWVPAFLTKLDVIPGKTNYMDLTPTALGEYDGKCAELCGEYHSEMLFNVKVVSQADFDAYLTSLKDKGQTGTLGNAYDRNPNLNKK